MPKISHLSGRPILDSRGDWTIEVAIGLNNGLQAIASVPQGKSKSSFEAFYVSPEKAVKNIEKTIAPKIIGEKIGNQLRIDKILLNLDGTKEKKKLGGNAILGVSLAYARISALAQKIPLWRYINKISGLKIGASTPHLLMNIINGGLHANNNLNFQEYIVIPKTEKISEAVKIGLKIYNGLKDYLKENYPKGAINVGDEGGFAPIMKNDEEPFDAISRVAKKMKLESKISFGLDAAASDIKWKPKKLFDFYGKLFKKFKLIYLEDPFSENDFKNFKKLREISGNSCLITGDDLTSTNPQRISAAYKKKSLNGVIIKPNQIGTLSETLEAVKLARKYGWAVIVSHRSGETNDDFIVDLAFGVGADGIKLGAPSRGERIAKYDRALEIGKK